MRRLKLGTRGSRLARRQADMVTECLLRNVPGIAVEQTVITTTGDRNPEAPLSGAVDKALFTKEIEAALLAGAIDIAAHSLKDLPSALDPGLVIGAVLQRENPCDALLAKNALSFAGLPSGATVGTSSLRRAAQIRALRPDITIAPLRGNVETRIKKMDEAGLDGIILAYAGIRRLGLESCITQVMDPQVIVPAPGQGAIAVEARAADRETLAVLAKISHMQTVIETGAERAFLQRLQGGCQVPAGCLAQLSGSCLSMRGCIASPDGTAIYAASMEGNPDEAEALGRALAEKLLADGAANILKALLGKAG